MMRLSTAAWGMALSMALAFFPQAVRPQGGGSGGGQAAGSSEDRASLRERPRAIFVTGRVVLEDGSVAREPVVIQRVCFNVISPEGYADTRGNFSVQLGAGGSALPDASIGPSNPVMGPSNAVGVGGLNQRGELSERDLQMCQLRAYLIGYVSDSIPLAGRGALDGSDVGVIVLHRFGNVEGSVVSVTDASAPKKAVQALDKGREATGKGKWTDARKQFEKAVEIHPQFAAAWNELGRVHIQLNAAAAARKAFERAVAADSKYLPPQIQLADLAFRERNWTSLLEITERILKLDPVNLPGVYVSNSIAHFMLENMDAAEKSARQALKLDSQQQFPKADHMLGLILARRGDFNGAVEHFRAYLQLAPAASDSATVKRQLAEVEQMAQTAPLKK
jgi:tetratricopeptide (TPR) repeat protein